jgi:hypothetical protein
VHAGPGTDVPAILALMGPAIADMFEQAAEELGRGHS